MKRLFLLIICSLMAATAFAQYAETSIPLLGAVGIIAGNMKPVTDNVSNGMSAADKLITIGGCGALASLAMIASGIPTLCVYKKILNSTFNEYMSGISSDAYMAFGPTGNGVGFALNF